MKVDAAIIGAGPAGLSAAIEIAKMGLSVAIVDEYYRSGGRLLGQLYEDPKQPSHSRLWDGRKIAEGLAAEARQYGVHILCGVTAWSASPSWQLHLSASGAGVGSVGSAGVGSVDGTGANGSAASTEASEHGLHRVTAKRLLLATGAAERAVPLPGWTLPGVVSVGAAQTFTNVHRVALGRRVLIVGIDPLSISVAMEMKHVGIDVVGMALPVRSSANGKISSPMDAIARLSAVSDLAPNPLLRFMGRMSAGRFERLAAHLLRGDFLRIAGIPVMVRKAVTSIEGIQSVEAVTLQSVTVDGTPVGHPETIAVDTVCLSGGLYPLADFAQTVGCPLIDIPELGGVVPLHGSDMSTPTVGLYVAGNITGIESAKVAMAQGRLAGVSIAHSLGRRPAMTIEQAAAAVTQARQESSFKFLPNIEQGRAKMMELWSEGNEIEGASAAWRT
jgi:sarcosine oxidase, subunit alpha